MKLQQRRWFSNSHQFSEGHNTFLPRENKMFDLDAIKLSSNPFPVTSTENAVYLEHKDGSAMHPVIEAVFSLKHRAIRNDKAFNFTDDVTNRAIIYAADKIGCRLFVVFHGGSEDYYPIELYEVDTMTGLATYAAKVESHTAKDWTRAWQRIGLM